MKRKTTTGTLGVINRTMYHTEDGPNYQSWIHPRPECIVLAKLKGHTVKEYHYDGQWRDDLSRCCGCGEFINWHGDHDS